MSHRFNLSLCLLGVLATPALGELAIFVPSQPHSLPALLSARLADYAPIVLNTNTRTGELLLDVLPSEPGEAAALV